MDLVCFQKIKGESAREYVTRVLRANILNLNLKPGQLINENEIAELLNISRTPIREAIIRLTQESLIETFPQRGTYISKINLRYVEEGWFARITMEKAIIKLVCESYTSDSLIQSMEENLHMLEYYIGRKDYLKIILMDDEFHRIIYKACDKERICLAIESLNNDYYRVRYLSLSSTSKIEAVLSQHNEIKNAIKEKDFLRAQKAVEEHLKYVALDQEIIKNEYSEYLMH